MIDYILSLVTGPIDNAPPYYAFMAFFILYQVFCFVLDLLREIVYNLSRGRRR